MTHPLSSADISIFSPEISNFCCIKKYRYRLHFNACLLILFTFFESLKFVLMNMGTILMMTGKIATLGLLKIKIFRNKDYDVIISAHNVTNKVLSHVSNYIVDVVI